ncbi:conserved hypothetical protein [Aspergillus terreus NIH2624]|uniref:Uncharacterized protein n=1 Tax=Aspergillus terreus (strain NIH 2624 / FGSC A1156) TaxID=341663 RepID=Q0CC23_ASPTN|nr:uncharacterized protein ATEG_08761 [Aspergillus terreus NIH2624]EAU30893.1 conserved hypothetical protein [Aspergillus terreus NIH2624]
MSSQNLPTYASRHVPSYYGTAEDGSSMVSPRYAPHVQQPWRRQQALSSLSFIPSTSPRSEHSEYTTSQQHPHPQQPQPPQILPRRPVADRSSACVSPFRSVRKMKQPFQLRLPSSPSYDTNPSPVSSRDSRTPSANHSLRTWRSDGNLMTTSLETFGLLPSPPLSDYRTSQHSPSSTYFSPKIDSDTDTEQGTPKSNTGIPDVKHYNMHRTSTPETLTEYPNKTPGATNVHMAHSHMIRQCEPSEDGKYTPMSMASERMSSPPVTSDIAAFGKRDFSGSSMGTQRSRSGTVSSEASWAASNLSYCERWLQGAPIEPIDENRENARELSRRKYQIVQNSPPPRDRKRDMKSTPDEPLMFASVASKSKPKLVDISRQSSPATSYSIPTPPQQPLPCTPDQRLQEISAFSPETPLAMSDSGYGTHRSCYSPEDFPGDKEDDSVEASSIGSGSASETVVCHSDKPAADDQFRPKSMPKPTLRANARPTTNPSQRHSSNPSPQEELEKWWDHEWTIDQLEQSARDFPRNMLKLTSPAIMFLRHNNEKALIRPFRKIFPESAENLLDSLCAALIAQNYVVSLSAMSFPNRRTSNFSQKPSLSRLDTVPERVPEKACSTLGIHYPQTSPTRIKDRVLGSRSMELRRELDRIVDNLLLAIAGKQDETLKAAVLVLAQVLETNS